MAASAPARHHVVQRLAVVMIALSVALSGLLLGPPAATGSATHANAVSVRSQPSPVQQVGSTQRDSGVVQATESRAQQPVPAGGGAATAFPPVTPRLPTLFVCRADEPRVRFEDTDVDGFRGRAPPVATASAAP